MPSRVTVRAAGAIVTCSGDPVPTDVRQALDVRRPVHGGDMNLTIRPLGTEVLHISTDSDEQESGPDGDVTSYPVGFTAHMDRPHESETPDRDW